MSALANGPKFELAKGQKRLEAQRQDLRQRLKARPNDPYLKNALQQVRTALGRGPSVAATQPPPTSSEPAADFNSVTNSANQATEGLFQQIGNQGAFNPGAYQMPFQDMHRGAMEAAMESARLDLDPRFKQQDAAFEQMAAERGWDPRSEIYQTMRSNMMGDQERAYRQARNDAYGQGLQAQQQGFGQAMTQYQMPYQNLGAMAPFYGAQAASELQGSQQDFQRQMAARQHQYNLELQKNAPRGGGLTLQDQMALQNNAFYNNLVLQGMQQGQQYPMPNQFGNGVAQGIGAGVGAAIGSALR